MAFLYSVNYDINFKDLCEYEIYTLFNQRLDNRYIISDMDIDVNQCVFIKEKMKILNEGKDFFSLISSIYTAKHQINDFKIVTLNISGQKLEHKKQLPYMITTSYCIDGIGTINDPKCLLAIAQVDDCWYFGYYEKNKQTYKIQNARPHSYSNSLPYDVSRSLINIAINNNPETTIVDPCAGACTVVIDGLLQGYLIDGYEINPGIGVLGQENINYLGLDYQLNIMDMQLIEKTYDVAIVDIPYGLFSDTTEMEQQLILNKCHKIVNRLLLITSVDMTDMLQTAGFIVKDEVKVLKKGKNAFSRILYVCERK